jgi:hypothetical protein
MSDGQWAFIIMIVVALWIAVLLLRRQIRKQAEPPPKQPARYWDFEAIAKTPRVRPAWEQEEYDYRQSVIFHEEHAPPSYWREKRERECR